MQPVQAPEILTAVVVYLVICLGIGWWAMRRTHTMSDFLVAGRALEPMVVVVATMSSIMSGFGFVGGPGLVYQTGTASFWMTVTCTFGMPFAWVTVGKRLRLLAEAREILTLPDAVAARYGEGAPRAAMAIAILLGVLGYLGTQILAIGIVLVAVLQVDLLTALVIGVGVLAFYSVAGGIIAGVYTDLFQGAVMLFAALAVLYQAVTVAGGLPAISETLWRMDPAYFGPWGTTGPLTALSWYLLFALGGVGQPHGITKFLMLKDIRRLKWGALMTGFGYAFLSVLWMSIGVSMRALVESGVQPELAQPDLAAPEFLMRYCPRMLAAVVFAGLLAAIMSTADSFVNIGAAAICRDIPIAWKGRPIENELFWSRIATGGLLVGSAIFALYMQNLIALLGTFGWGTFAAAIVPSLALGLNWKRATRVACVGSVALSVGLNFSLELMARHNIWTLPYGVNAGAVALLASLIFFVAVSLGTPQEQSLERIPEDVRAAMDV